MFHSEYNGKKSAGVHILIDLWYTREPNLDEVKLFIEETTRASGSQLIQLVSHEFNECGGISAIALISQSHISYHSWPEYGYTAIDIFTCGLCNKDMIIDLAEAIFKPKKMEAKVCSRGLLG